MKKFTLYAVLKVYEKHNREEMIHVWEEILERVFGLIENAQLLERNPFIVYNCLKSYKYGEKHGTKDSKNYVLLWKWCWNFTFDADDNRRSLGDFKYNRS